MAPKHLIGSPDTIVIKIHDLQKHSFIANMCRFMSEGNHTLNTLSKSVTLDSMFGELDFSLPFEVQTRRIYDFKTQKKREHIKTDFKKFSPSYAYEIRGKMTEDFIRLEFSLPKFFYGHNLLMLVNNPHYKNLSNRSGLSGERFLVHETSYEVFINALKKSLNHIFVGAEIDYTCVEICRLDLCFNEIYNSNNQIEKQKKLDILPNFKNPNFKQYNNLNVKPYESNGVINSIIALNHNTYMKVYNKGAEFRNNDKSKLIKINDSWLKDKDKTAFRGKKYKPFDIPFLEKYSDNILRYEIKYDRKKMIYHFNKYMRTKSPYLRNVYKTYKSLQSEWERHLKYQSFDIKTNFFDSLKREQFKECQKLYRTLFKDDKRFFVELSPEQEEENKELIKAKKFGQLKNLKYTRLFHDFLCKNFTDFVDGYKIEHVSDVNLKEILYAKKTEDRNKLIKKYQSENGFMFNELPFKVSKKQVFTVFRFIKNYGSIEEGCKEEGLSKMTKSRYLRIAKAMNISGLDIDYDINGCLDYNRYFSYYTCKEEMDNLFLNTIKNCFSFLD